MWERWLPILLFRASSSSSVKTYVWGDEKRRLLPGLELVLLLTTHPKAGLAAMLPCQAPGSRGTEGQQLPHCSPFPIKPLQTLKGDAHRPPHCPSCPAVASCCFLPMHRTGFAGAAHCPEQDQHFPCHPTSPSQHHPCSCCFIFSPEALGRGTRGPATPSKGLREAWLRCQLQKKCMHCG